MAKKMRWSDRSARPSGCVVTLLFATAALGGLAHMFLEVIT
jgi:hypothetical protein